jgi:hypothetical protein
VADVSDHERLARDRQRVAQLRPSVARFEGTMTRRTPGRNQRRASTRRFLNSADSSALKPSSWWIECSKPKLRAASTASNAPQL